MVNTLRRTAGGYSRDPVALSGSRAPARLPSLHFDLGCGKTERYSGLLYGNVESRKYRLRHTLRIGALAALLYGPLWLQFRKLPECRLAFESHLQPAFVPAHDRER